MSYVTHKFKSYEKLYASQLNEMDEQIAKNEKKTEELTEKITTDEYKKDVAALVPIVKVADDPTFVDSVDEMTDTGKAYVLTTDGMIYVYKTTTIVVPGGKVPNFTNIADPASSDWKEGYRLNSSGAPAEEAGTTVTNYIPILQNQVIRIKGIDLTTKNASVSKADKVNIHSSKLSTMTSYFANISVTTTEASFTVTNANLRWIRFAGVRNGTASDVIITVDQEITYTEAPPTTETVSGFFSTGIVYNQPADYEDRVIALETDVANNTGNIALLQKRVGNLESGEAETVIPTFWQTAVDECIAKIKALQVGRNCVTFPFFSDNHQRNGYAGALIAKIMEECHIPYCFYGGDSISSGTIANEAAMIAEDKAFDAMMSYVPNGRFCRAVGNHDGYWDDGTNKHTYTRAQVYELFLREEAVAQNKHFGDDGTYYYVDDIASKVRFVVLNTNGGNVDSAQLEWMQDTALSFNENGWAVVFISHQPISNHYHANISNAAEVRVAVQDYINGSASNKAAVVGWFSGHIHRDRIYTGAATNTTDDAQGAAMGFTQATITSDHTGIAYDDATKHAVANDDQSHAVDFVTINKDTRTVNLTRLGIGADRSYTY